MGKRRLWGVRAGIVVALAVGSTASCSSGTGGGGSSGAFTSEATYCSQRDARTKSCAPETGAPPFDAGTVDGGGNVVVVSTSCAKDYRCKAAILASPDVYFNCRGNPDCSAKSGDEACTMKAGEGRSTADADACLKKYNECKASGVKTFNNDTCTILSALNAATAQKVMNCVVLACDLAATCFKDLENQIPECD